MKFIKNKLESSASGVIIRKLFLSITFKSYVAQIILNEYLIHKGDEGK